MSMVSRCVPVGKPPGKAHALHGNSGSGDTDGPLVCRTPIDVRGEPSDPSVSGETIIFAEHHIFTIQAIRELYITLLLHMQF
jgi:hypothetical protein